MAGPATSPRRWMLSSALLVVLLAAYNESPSTSLQSNAAKSQFWMSRVRVDRAEGSGEQGHRDALDLGTVPSKMVRTDPPGRHSYTPSKGPRRFK